MRENLDTVNTYVKTVDELHDVTVGRGLCPNCFSKLIITDKKMTCSLCGVTVWDD